MQQGEVGERREPRTKVVEGKGDAEVAELFHNDHGVGDVEERHALGDLDHQALTRKTVFAQRFFNGGYQVRIVKLACGEVDGYEEIARVIAELFPRPCGGDGLSKREVSEIQDQIALFSRRNEDVRRYPSSSRVIPAHERLESDDPPALKVKNGLIVHRQVSGLKRLAKLLNQRELIDGLLMHARREECEAPLAQSLGLVERNVRVLEELGAVGEGVVGHHDADARADGRQFSESRD